MKKLLYTCLLAACSLAFYQPAAAQSVSVNISLFQQQLQPYGRWINSPRFGQAWVYNKAGFRPYYTDGHWEYTNYGWSWVSDYDWGWAPFHYGRWEHDPGFGWMWIPGYEWAPAWVTWSSYDGYYGWAPLGYGSGTNVSFGSVPFNNWTFVPRNNICERNLSRYYVPQQKNYQFRNAVIINNIYIDRGSGGRFYRGPERNEVERYTHNRIQERRIDIREQNGNRFNNDNSNGNRADNQAGDRRYDNNNNGYNNNNDANRPEKKYGNNLPKKEGRTDNQINRPDRRNNGQQKDNNPNLPRGYDQQNNGWRNNNTPQNQNPANDRSRPQRSMDKREPQIRNDNGVSRQKGNENGNKQQSGQGSTNRPRRGN